MAKPAKSTNGRADGKDTGRGLSGVTDEFDLASDIKGNNSLKGADQKDGLNQRQEQADAKGETDSLQESFEKLDKDVRAQRDLGKKSRTAAGKS
jgi:hypothetical protein